MSPWAHTVSVSPEGSIVCRHSSAGDRWEVVKRVGSLERWRDEGEDDKPQRGGAHPGAQAGRSQGAAQPRPQPAPL
eukprot:scaffold92085_cov37-Prasinocladus_malaysianus.AAC.2